MSWSSKGIALQELLPGIVTIKIYRKTLIPISNIPILYFLFGSVTHFFNAVVVEAGFTCTKDGCECTEERYSNGPCDMYKLHIGDEDMSGKTPQDDCLWLSSFRYEKSGSSSEIEIYEFAVVEKVMETPSELQGEYQQYSSQSGLASFITI